MHAFSSEHRRSLMSGHSAVRLLIVSYFIALALGLIEGTDMSVLASAVMPEGIARLLMSAFVLVLSALILVGWYRRVSALVLALSMFWASYLAMMSAPDQNIGAFWRDLALIGALVMTYADGYRGIMAHEAKASGNPEGHAMSRLSHAFSSTRTVMSRPSSRSVSKTNNEKTELFRKDLDIVRAS